MYHRSLDKDKADSFLFDAPKMGFNAKSVDVHGLVVPLRSKRHIRDIHVAFTGRL